MASLLYDQVGSLRVVADAGGNVIKEVLYDPFGGIIEDSNPGLCIPIGFAGGLHDRDLGFVRFGWRDYDTFTSRWTAPDPLGDEGGDPDWYGYCLDDPVNGVDPLGLFKFGKRGLGELPLLGIFSNNPIDDATNTELAHEHGLFEDGSKEDIGFFQDGVRPDTKKNLDRYEMEDKRYDDDLMRESLSKVEPGKYKKLTNNCQDFTEQLRKQYKKTARNWSLSKGRESFGR